MENIIQSPIQLPDVKTVSNLRKYFIEYSVLGLAASVVTLFYMFNNLNTYIRSELVRNQQIAIEAIKENTESNKSISNDLAVLKSFHYTSPMKKDTVR